MALAYLAVLVLFGWLMISRRLTATLALPLTALTIATLAFAQALVAGEPATATFSMLLTTVLEGGFGRLATAIFAVILGAVLAAQMQLSGAAERMVRYAAEYAGEDRFWLGFTLLLVIALLFTVLGGLGAVILVASVTLPLLLTLGYEPKSAAALFLFGLSLGGTLNPANWALYKDVLQLPVGTTVVPFAATLALIFLAVAVAYLLYEDRSGGWGKRTATVLALVIGIGALAWFFGSVPAVWHGLKVALWWLMLTALALLWILVILRGIVQALGPAGTMSTEGNEPHADLSSAAPSSRWLSGPDNWLSALSVLVPLLLLLWSSLNANLHGTVALQIPLLTALLAGIVYAALAAFSADATALNRLMRALHQGVTHAAPAVVLLFGIGLLLQATTLPMVQATLEPWVMRLPVDNPALFVGTFFVLSPLALYRGPLNLFGMGAPIVGIIHGSGILEGSLIMVAFFAVGMLQGVSDPTNTHNVWISSFCKVPVAELTRHTLPWVLAIVLGGLIAGAVMFRTAFGQ